MLESFFYLFLSFLHDTRKSFNNFTRNLLVITLSRWGRSEGLESINFEIRVSTWKRDLFKLN